MFATVQCCFCCVLKKPSGDVFIIFVAIKVAQSGVILCTPAPLLLKAIMEAN